MEVVLPWPAGQRCSLTREVPDGGLLVSPAAHESNRESRRLCCSRGAAGNYPSIRILRTASTTSSKDRHPAIVLACRTSAPLSRQFHIIRRNVASLMMKWCHNAAATCAAINARTMYSIGSLCRALPTA